MRITPQLSIKNKAYLLVLMSVAVALILSFVTYSGLQAIRTELDELVTSTDIERHTGKLIQEEQRYRLSANGSVYDFAAAFQAHDNAMRQLNELSQTFDKVDELVMHGDDKLFIDIQKTRQSTDDYKNLYLTGVSVLTDLNYQAEVLQFEGEYMTSQVQEYVEGKRNEIKNNLSQKTIEKINAGSNIWQYTYVTQLLEKKYRSSPDEAVLTQFKKDYQFMLDEWKRLKAISDQSFELEKLENFYSSAKKYEAALFKWIDLNSQLIKQIRPGMIQQEENIIASAIQSAERSISHISDKRNTIEVSLIVVTLITIILGIIFGAMIANSISSVISSFQNGLLGFFRYLNKQQETIDPIAIQGNDEISVMAKVVNENILKVRKVLDRKSGYHQALLEWSKVDYQDENITINKATELSAKALNVERVSIWLFNEDLTSLTCADLYVSDLNKHESGAVLLAKDYPEYFKTISTDKILVAENARVDPRTKEFNEHYLKPLDIYSIMDVCILHNKQPIGVICHEKVGEIKTWELDEQDFAGSVVNSVSLSLEIKKRRRIQDELKNQKEILHYQAHHDVLTHLPNRFLFNDRLNQVIKQAQRNESKLAVLFIDLDHFKGINDTMGHKVGDEVLIEVASRLKERIRQTDTLARLGGDEFSIILTQVSSNDDIVDLTQDLISCMSAPIVLPDQSFYITLSVGVAIYPENGLTSEELLKNSDAAMYQAKDDGRNTYQFYTQAMTEKAFERIAMETSFRNALKNEEFVVYYQSQVNADTGQLIGMEALVRWAHPGMGLISPAKFLTFANDTGLIIPMDYWMMKTAMTQYAAWYKAELKPGVLALNLSAKQLKEENLLEKIQGLMEEAGFLPKWLELEVTEGHIMEDPATAIQLLNRLKDLGISLAIDDFGTGYSSLSQLKRLPINKLKIDRSFIRDVPYDEDDVVITKSIIALAKNMGLSVIAEGVETEQQRDFLLKNDCHNMQGYFYSKPLIAAEVEERLKT